MNLKIDILKEEESYPYELLLLADETVDAINKYLFDSEVYLVKKNSENVGVFCLYRINDQTIELKNIAVAEHFQSKGVGSLMIDFIKEKCSQNCKTLIVGTADCGHQQIRFYEKNGFVKYDVRRNFFIENYEKPIFENGIQLKHMLMMKYEF